MNAIYVINQGGMLQPNALASMLDAALRWNVDFREVTEMPDAGDVHPAIWKLSLLRQAETDGNTRLLILDADTVISDKCPSPFTTFRREDLVVVTDRQVPHGPRDKAEVDEVEIVTGRRRLLKNYFNSGVVLADVETHWETFEVARVLADSWKHLCWHDQTTFNLAAEHCPHLTYADTTWNFLNPAGRLPDWEKMQKHIYHFAGNPDRNLHIQRTRWNS